MRAATSLNALSRHDGERNPPPLFHFVGIAGNSNSERAIASAFFGERLARRKPPTYQELIVWLPRTWLLRVGWRRHGLIRADEVPGPLSTTTHN